LQDLSEKDGLEEDIADGYRCLHAYIIDKCCDEFSERRTGMHGQAPGPGPVDIAKEVDYSASLVREMKGNADLYRRVYGCTIRY
jgi:hypothetical protein